MLASRALPSARRRLPPTPPVERIEVEVAAEVLSTYVGQYETAPNVFVDISLENGALFVQAAGRDKLPLFAESETRFFLKAADIQSLPKIPSASMSRAQAALLILIKVSL